MPEVTITPKHARLIAFIAGKGVTQKGEKSVTLQLSDNELGPLLRKAKEHGFEDQIVVKAATKAEKAAAKAKLAEAEEATETPSEEEAVEEVAEEATDAPTRRRRHI